MRRNLAAGLQILACIGLPVGGAITADLGGFLIGASVSAFVIGLAVEGA